MRALTTSDSIKIPEGVTVTLKARVLTVTGTRGTLTKSFKHLNLDMQLVGKKTKSVLVSVYFGSKRDIACIRTVLSHIKNMVTGVTKGFEYKMRLVYAHFPINVTTVNNGKELEIRNFLGEKMVRKVPMLEGVLIERSEKVKDELTLVGNDIELVSQSAANVHQSTTVPEKDIRKFLDGIYVSERKVLGDD
eukprot:TRINITY_DN6_c0_g1_i1.p2 TRINITY_DN6_c0_g1~~TRINITY_DN6_c0_g1_i1.p2  ORF type:complete len:217 (-),score=49.51 TRINITY_DN6_c0_g1_i1:80-652(-)